jgi:hypothetical protein
MGLLEELAVRLGWIAWAFQLKMKPGLCPPECREGHTYLWPCRQRIRKSKLSTVGAYHDKNIKDSLLEEDRLDP